MAITSAIVLFAVIWFMLLLIALPMRMKSQGEDGNVVPGTPSSAPADPMIKKKIKWVTLVTILLWVPLCAIILLEIVTVADIDFFDRMSSR